MYALFKMGLYGLCTKHVTLATDQVDNMKRVLDAKMTVLDQLSTQTKKCVDAEHNRIMPQVNADRDQAYTQIDQSIEEYKQQIREKSTKLNQLP